MIGERHEERNEAKMERKSLPKGGKSESKRNDPRFVQERPANYSNRYKGELAPEKDIEQIRPGNYKDDRYK
jgi:hypothetical protein